MFLKLFTFFRKKIWKVTSNLLEMEQMVKIDTELCIKRLFEGKIVQSRMEPDFVALAYVQKLHWRG